MTDAPRKICFVTGSRADFGLLIWPMRAIQQTAGLKLQLIATGMHLSPEFGYTIDNIRDEGFAVDETVETLLSSDSGVGVAKSVGLGVIGFADAFARLKPDLVVVLGDRYETFAAAQAAMYMRLPMAHLFGGDVTEGAIDESIRHAISKMSHLHFTTNANFDAAADPARRRPVAHLHGWIARHRFDQAPEADGSRDHRPRSRNGARRTQRSRHLSPASRSKRTARSARSMNCSPRFPRSIRQFRLFFTLANADAEGRALNERIKAFVAGRPNAIAVASLGQLRYISLMNQVDVVVGNSSSGIYEAPSLNAPSVDIGDRQKGRERAASVFHARCRNGKRSRPRFRRR